MTHTSAPQLEAAIREVLVPALRTDKFAGSGRTFRRVRDDWVQVVNVQGSRWGGSFAINLAVHPLALPDLGGNTPDPKRITEDLCEFRRRLSATSSDQWWKHEATAESILAAMAQASDVYVRYGRPLLERVSGPNNPMNTVQPEKFALGEFDFGGFGSTGVRMALSLARLRQAAGRVAEASAFAAHGLRKVGAATFLRRELEMLASQQ